MRTDSPLFCSVNVVFAPPACFHVMSCTAEESTDTTAFRRRVKDAVVAPPTVEMNRVGCVVPLKSLCSHQLHAPTPHLSVQLLPTVKELKPFPGHSTMPPSSVVPSTMSTTANAAVVAGTAAAAASMSMGVSGSGVASVTVGGGPVGLGASLIIGGAGPGGGARQARHSSHGQGAIAGALAAAGSQSQAAYRPAGYGYQQAAGSVRLGCCRLPPAGQGGESCVCGFCDCRFTTKPPAYRVGQMSTTYAPLTKPPSRGAQRGVADGLLAPPRTQEVRVRSTSLPLPFFVRPCAFSLCVCCAEWICAAWHGRNAGRGWCRGTLRHALRWGGGEAPLTAAALSARL